MLARICVERGTRCDARQAVRVTGRPVALGRAIGNVVDNAIRYGGAAHVSLARGQDHAW